MPQSLSAQLRTGRIAVEVAQGVVPPEALFGFAERRNPKRSFLFVSRVLGRHIPVRPAVMRDSYTRLAAQLDADMPGPVLFIGMAETAVALGAGVHRAFVRATGRGDCLFLPTARHALDSETLRFEEEHSHAPAQLLHRPVDPAMAALPAQARSLVLVDDEASTGRTFANLLAALHGAGIAQGAQVTAVMLTDWSDGAAAAQLGEAATTVALLRGRYRWQADPAATPPDMPLAHPPHGQPQPLDPAADWGRRGRTQPLALAPEAGLGLPRSGRVLVLGTGEYVWPPFLLAEKLEALGADVHVGAVTRSPIAPGHAIGCALAFGDNYGLGIPNFLYNVRREDWDSILLCAETPAAAQDPTLLAALDPILICPDTAPDLAVPAANAIPQTETAA